MQLYQFSLQPKAFPLEDLANEAGFSKYHFARLFKEMTGTTCHNFVLGRRIIYAKNLLMDFSLPITEVAMRAGFNSLATFKPDLQSPDRLHPQ